MIDKWGLLQRPFSGRDSSVVEQMVEVTDQILDVMARECGVQGWIAFGTLLGAAREGKVIGHDSDIDLAYLSEKPTPAEMAQELYEHRPRPAPLGLRVLPKSGSFITVVFTSPDGDGEHRRLHLLLRRRPAPRDRDGACRWCRARRSCR